MTQQACSRLSDHTSRTAAQNPSAPSPTATTGAVGSRAVDLETIHQQRAERELRFKPQPFAKPTGSFWTVIITVMLLIGATALGWLALGVLGAAQGAVRTAGSK